MVNFWSKWTEERETRWAFSRWPFGSTVNATACSFAKNAVMIQPRRVLINGAFRTGYVEGVTGSFQENIDESGCRCIVTVNSKWSKSKKGEKREKVVETLSMYFKNVHSIYHKPRIRRARLTTRVISRTLDEGRKRETRGERRNKTESGRERERERETEREGRWRIDQREATVMPRPTTTTHHTTTPSLASTFSPCTVNPPIAIDEDFPPGKSI